MANSRHSPYRASHTLTNCHSAFAKNSQNTASINTVKHKKKTKLERVIFPLLTHTDHLSCSQRCHLARIQMSSTATVFPRTLKHIFETQFGAGAIGRKKTLTSKATRIPWLTTGIKAFSMWAFLFEEFFFCLEYLGAVNIWKGLFVGFGSVLF